MIQKSFEATSKGTLFLVPTPIGNLEDMTFRAIRTLSQVDKILSEDTRHTQKLLNHFDIQTPQMSFHEHNTQSRIPHIVEQLLEGKSFAQVSDAGTPSISDPGFELVQACIEHDIAVVPLPGANAAITALIASGLVPQPFYFYGFLPRKKKERVMELEHLAKRSETVILYESPFRLKEAFSQIVQVYGEQQRVVLCRELTKRYEEFIRGTAQELLEHVSEQEVKGECCILIGHVNAQEVSTQCALTQEEKEATVEERISQKLEEGLTLKEAIKLIAKETGMKKQEVYRVAHQLEE